MPINARTIGHAVLAASALLCAGLAQATIVNGFDASYTANGQWFNADVRPGGSASVVDLSAAGGNLQNNQPLPNGAALLTTNNTNAAKAEVSVNDVYGKAGEILRSLSVGYDFYRSNNPGQNAAAAPSLKLTFYNPSYAGDGFVSLIYEAYWQGSGNPASDQWTHVGINYQSGLFWQNGGFGQANSAGGPPLNTLAGWLAAFDSGFGEASLVSVSMGLGTFNPGVTGYFDNVTVSHSFGNGYAAAYDFEAAAVPEPASFALAAIALLGAGLASRRRSRR